MNNEIIRLYSKIQNEIDELNKQMSLDQESNEYTLKFKKCVDDSIKQLSSDAQKRIFAEFFGFGPIEDLVSDENVTEILINSYDNIFFEKSGEIQPLDDQFCGALSYRNCINRLLDKSHTILSLEKPFSDFKFQDFRVSIVDESISHGQTLVSLRRHPKRKWTLEMLYENGWCNPTEKDLLEKVISFKKNFLVIGGTGTGKTSIVNALLDKTQAYERSLIIEDTQEIQLPNPLCVRLITRDETTHGLCMIDQSQLVKRALRLRPDRLIMGEIRGHEAKDFLMALSTGHLGSFGTLHANDPQQALLRLEMLIQMGAPHWGLSAIRKLMSLSLDVIIVTERKPCGKRVLEGIYRLSSLEENGFLVERLCSDYVPSGFFSI